MRERFDERQILERGRVFQWGFVAALLAMVLVFMLTDVFGLSISRYGTFLVSIWIPMGTVMIGVILRDAFEGVSGTFGGMVASVLGGCGLLVIALMVARGEPVFYAGGVSDNACTLFASLVQIAVSATYWFKRLRDRRAPGGD